MSALEPAEEIVLLRMYNMRIIGIAGYLPIKKVETKVEWQEIQGKYGYPKNFRRLLDRLFHLRLIDDHGKSRQVASLSGTGVAYVIAMLKQKKYGDEMPKGRILKRG